jgi:hypothetical protein
MNFFIQNIMILKETISRFQNKYLKLDKSQYFIIYYLETRTNLTFIHF